jgi:ABC-2 type transport system permease protein
MMGGRIAMTSSFRVFIRRLASDWSYQIQAVRLAVDWIIAIYFVIPVMLIAGYHYYTWWMKPPEWFSWIPLILVVAVFYIFSWLGTIRYFVEEGDQLFLRQNERWFKHLMVQGWRYSLILQAVTTSLLVFLLLPLLVKTYLFSEAQIISMLIVTYLLKVSLGLARQLLVIHLYGPLLTIVRIMLFVGGFFLYEYQLVHFNEMPVYSWTSMACLFVLLVILSIWRLRQKGAFFADIARESDSRMRIVSILLIRVVRRKRKRIVRRRPLLFSKSQRLFKGTVPSAGISDLLVKSFYRNGTQWTLTLQFVAIMGVALFFLPGVLKIILWIVSACILAFWRRKFCKEELAAPFLHLFDIHEKSKLQALQNVMPFMVMPALLVLSLCVGFSLAVWWGPVVMLAVAVPLAFGTSSVFSSWY